MQALELITASDDFSPRRFFVTVKCTDPYWGGEIKRIEVHSDVARYIFELKKQNEELQKEIGKCKR